MNIAGLFRGLTFIGWMLVVLAIGVVIVRAARGQALKNGLALVLGALGIAVVLSAVSAGLVFIKPDERGVVITAAAPGYRQEALPPGLHWIVPFAESVVPYPISRQTYTMSIAPSEGEIQGDDSITARTLDGQEIYVDASVIYAIDPAKVVQVHINWGDRYSAELVRAHSRGVIRDAVSQFSVEEVVSTRRFELSKMMHDNMSAKLSENGLELVDFVLRNITFSPEYAASVEQKQIAEQQAQQARFIVEQRRQEAEQARQVAQGRADAVVIDSKGDAEARLIAAEAEAKALEMIAEALQSNPDLLTYQYINKISPNVQVMFLPNNAPFIFPLPEVGPAAPQ